MLLPGPKVGAGASGLRKSNEKLHVYIDELCAKVNVTSSVLNKRPFQRYSSKASRQTIEYSLH